MVELFSFNCAMSTINRCFIFFVLGLYLGSYLAVYIKSKRGVNPAAIRRFINLPKPLSINNNYYSIWFESMRFTRSIEPIDTVRYSNNWQKTEAQVLRDNIKVLCVILSDNEKTAKAAVHTWAKGCNNVTITDTGSNHDKHKLPSMQNTKNSNWSQFCAAIADMEYGKFEWVIFVREQTFVLLENLRWFVASLDYLKGYYLGHAEVLWNVRYNLAQAGFVLSRGSLEVLKREFEESGCKTQRLVLNKLDFTLGKILSKHEIYPIDTRDSDGYSTFNAYNWQQELFSGMNYYRNAIYPRKCCSSRAITFKGIEQDKFYMYQYLLYQLDVFHDGNLGNKPLSPPKDKDFVWKQFLAERGIYRNVSAEEYYDIWTKSILPEMLDQVDKNYD